MERLAGSFGARIDEADMTANRSLERTVEQSGRTVRAFAVGAQAGAGERQWPARSTESLGVMGKALAALLAIAMASANASAFADELRYRVYFPGLKLDSADGERIIGLRVWVECGRISGVSHIPRDWLIEMSQPEVGKTLLVASSNHGPSFLWKLGAWMDLSRLCRLTCPASMLAGQ